ncbi:hypothetical protein GCM10022243_33890 [Saccharothrix violaceirubra]|uniref:DUF2510 domain-containing protein n=1 Tax=Saccharothrix violaceirubra TaxID=413306 RepID=A0A7W7T4J6_9PSEU|nr:DUF2510 domain-containing protein [Saccharothrix violaceirubra]MBB4966443.1 hypothetical protein [Saccharothrix violaceirubra]
MTRPAAWLPDPLDDTLVRYWDGQGWTFYTAVREQPARPQPAAQPVAPPQPAPRADIARAVDEARGTLIGAMKEIGLLAEYLRPEERVVALAAAQGEGRGVLTCTNQRLLFVFVGMLRRQVLEVGWNQADSVGYDPRTGIFAVYRGKVTRRSVPVFAVTVPNRADVERLYAAARASSAVPRLEFG